jgi:hypothetical protein
MRILLLSLVLLPAPALARDPVAPAAEAPARPVCQNAKRQMVKPAPARVGKLSQMPQAKAYRAVLRLQDGCDIPVMINEEVGEQR